MIELLMRRREMAAKPLPYDAEVEWLESSGTQYINTGVYPDSTYTFDTSVTKLNNNYNLVYWGCRSSGTAATDDWQCFLNSNDTSGRTITQAQINLWTKKASAGVSGNWYSGVLPFIGEMYSFSGITVSSSLNRMTYPIVLFGFNAIGSINTSAGICRIGKFTAYSNGEKVVDMISVRVGQIGYMYDKVSGQLFGNAGTGNFIVGQDVNATKPYDAEVEWLKTDGSAYIDTGISGKCKFEIVGGITRTQANGVGFFGSRITNLDNAFCIFWFGEQATNGGKMRFDFGSGSTTNVQKYTNSAIPNDSKTSYNTLNFWAGSTNFVPSLNSQSPQSVNHYLMAINTNGTVTGLQSGTYIKRAAIIGLDGVLVRDYIPVRKNGVGYLYDKVSGTFFGNANSTGAFSYGNDVS